MRKLRFGVLSTANIGRAAVNPAIQASQGAELLAVASREKDRAAEFAQKWGIPRHYGSYEALLDDPDVDAVYIPLPNSLHREWTLRSAEKKKHVLCEKPLGLSAAECREMGSAAREHGVRLMEAFMYRFHPRTEAVLERIRGNGLGEVRQVHAVFTFPLRASDNIRWKKELGGGALLDVGCYCINVARAVAGREPVEVSAWATWTESGVDSEMTGSLRFEDGLVCQFECALSLERRESYEVAGREAWIHVSKAFLPGTSDAFFTEHRGRGSETRHDVAGADEYLRMVEHFCDSVREGTPLRCAADEAEKAMAVIEALYRSARDGGRPARL